MFGNNCFVIYKLMVNLNMINAFILFVLNLKKGCAELGLDIAVYLLRC